MFITRKSLPRAHIPEGRGCNCGHRRAWRWSPAVTAQSKTAARPLLQFGAVFVPNGAIMEQWIPRRLGSA